jgi:hypothetical protein
MRQIEQVGRMLAHILGLAKGGRGDEALGMFDEAYRPLVGVGSRVVAVLDDGQLIDLLTSGSNPDMRRVALALELLVAEAGLYADALFELIDERPGDPGPVDEAIAFCQRLRPLEAEQLAAGGLTREEVNATLAELLARPVAGEDAELGPSGGWA